MATMDVKDVIGDNLAKILEATTGKKRHAELAEAVNKLVASLQTGAFVVSSTSDLDKRKPDERSAGGAGGLPDDRVADLLVPIRLAMASRSPKIIEATLASVQKLIAHGLLRGDADLPPPARADAAGEEKAAPLVPDPEPSAVPPEIETSSSANEHRSSGDDLARASTKVSRESTLRVKADAHCAELVELVCAASDVPDETVELQMLKCLLTAVSSSTFRVRARALLRVVRACVNAYLGSAHEVNQQTAKASLTQMLAVVFHRLERKSRRPDAPAPTIVVADVFSSSLARRSKKRNSGSEESIAETLGVFKNRTHGVSAAALAAANAVKPTEEDAAAQMTSFVQGFINKVGADLTAVAAAAAGEDTDDIVEWVPASAAAQHREVTEREFDNDGDATPAKGGRRKDARMYGEDEKTSDDVGEVRRLEGASGEASTAETSEAPAEEHMSAFHTLEEDAFLVFRALCKLAKKPGDLTNPAVAQGKTLSLELLRILLENAGPAFRRSRRLGAAVSEYLCDAVVVCASQTVVPAAHGLALCAFLAALKNFRHTLKAEIAVFFPALLLDPLRGENNAQHLEERANENASSFASSIPLQKHGASSFQRRAVLLACARELCHDPRLMAELFVNYDCDLDSTNLFERFVDALAFVAAPFAESTSSSGAGDGAGSMSSVANGKSISSMTAEDVKLEHSLRLEALECLGVLLESLRDWVAGDCREDAAEEGGEETRVLDARSEETRETQETQETNAESEKTLAGIEAMKASKTEYQSAIALFNAKPKKGVAAMQKLKRCGETPAEIASFLRDTPDLDKTTVGDYLGERDEQCLTVMHAYVDAMDFKGMALDDAIRAFLAGFRLPGESQKIDRLMEKFAERFCVCNPGAYKSADTAYVLAFSVIMLNTDAHNPQVKHKMTKEGFLRNNRGIDDGADVPAAHLEELYDRIVSNEIRMKDEDPRLLAEKAELNAAKSASGTSASQSINRAMKDVSNRLGVDMLMSLMGGSKKTVHEVDTSEFMARVREHAARDAAGFQYVRDPNCAGIMFKSQLSRLCLSTFRDTFTAVPDNDSELEEKIVHACLAGYLAAAQLAAALDQAEALERCVAEAADMAAPRFVQTLETVKKPYAYARKNAEAMSCVVELAKRVGNAFDEKTWTRVLVAASRYDKIFSAAAGFDEASLFGGGAEMQREKNDSRSTRSTGASSTAFGSPWKGGDMGVMNLNALNVSAAFKNSPVLANVFGGAGVFGGANADESPFAHLKKRAETDAHFPPGTPQGVRGGPDAGATRNVDDVEDDDENEVQKKAHTKANPDSDSNPFDDLDSPDFVPPLIASMRALTPDAVSSLYLVSASLDGDAVVVFTRALCSVSSFELQSKTPRVCSLAKLVEVAHTNMDRVRFVWSKMWAVMSEFFTTACCHAHVELAMYAADSLRQLATKFLARGELLNYSFQNEFLKPFATVVRVSKSASIREFIVRCASSFVSGQAQNVKSGWKSVFAILTAAASDDSSTTQTLAFEIVEKIIREHFDVITETDPSTFINCVDCLIAFSKHAKDGDDGVVALNAVAFIRFCALKLADGEIGNLEQGVESAGAFVPSETPDGDGDGEKKDVPGDAERKNSVEVDAAAQKPRGATAFTEQNAHVFYWFPLLKGLSDLTFDARLEIRRSALEVLFDILDFHGGNFSPGFWFEAYDKVLLPIFDRVREGGLGGAAEDGTEDSEDSEEDSWVFQTTQHCLDLLVDLTAKHRGAIIVLTKSAPRGKETLEKMFDLFVDLATNKSSRQKLESCGVGAMHRLMLSNAGDALDEHGWSVAVDALARAMEATKPDVAGSLRKTKNAPEGDGASKKGAALIKARGETCALLAHAAAETYFARGSGLSAASLKKLVDALVSVAEHAAATDVDERFFVSETLPPLLALETEATRATLAVLLHLHAAETRRMTKDEELLSSEHMSLFSDAQAACGASTRLALVRLAVGILDRFASRVESASSAETSARAPLASDALRALARLDDEAFRAALFCPVEYGVFSNENTVDDSSRYTTRKGDTTKKGKTGYDALTRLVSSSSTPFETRGALSELFKRRVGPLLSRALQRDASLA